MSKNTQHEHYSGKGLHGYWRLLAYVRPYWKRLTIGLLAGMLVGGSVFVTLLAVPQMIGVVEVKSSQNDESAAAGRVVDALENSKTADKDAKIAVVRKALKPEETELDPQLAKMLSKAKQIGESLHLPFR